MSVSMFVDCEHRPLSLLKSPTLSSSIPAVDLLDGDALALGDIGHGLVALRDDADPLGNRLGRHRMVSRHHDDLTPTEQQTRVWYTSYNCTPCLGTRMP